MVKTANDLDIEVIGFRDGFRGVVVNEYLPLTPKEVVGILIKGGTILGSSNRDNPYHFKINKTEKLYMRICRVRLAFIRRMLWWKRIRALLPLNSGPVLI
ncbi:MAG TPA: hypothetical protein DEB05_09950 [Firmicutes bacterium]|nr:hypothetical protein [Bacillota bacterium]HBT17263.1 hypothetical protein [Bacillota bacterium]